MTATKRIIDFSITDGIEVFTESDYARLAAKYDQGKPVDSSIHEGQAMMLLSYAQVVDGEQRTQAIAEAQVHATMAQLAAIRAAR